MATEVNFRAVGFGISALLWMRPGLAGRHRRYYTCYSGNTKGVDDGYDTHQ